MPLKNYGVMKAKVLDKKRGVGPSPHYQISVTEEGKKHRIAINVKSKAYPSELIYFVQENFQNERNEKLAHLPWGYTLLEGKPDLALDYVRGNFFSPTEMVPLPHDVPGPDNDLNELIDKYVSKAIEKEDSVVYAFGEKWGPEEKADKYFGFEPGSGVHDIHMNQGNIGRWKRDNGIWQDGGLLIHYPSENQWVAIFLAFQSQSFETNKEGHRIASLQAQAQNKIEICSACFRTSKSFPRVTLYNSTEEEISLNGWNLASASGGKQDLSSQTIQRQEYLTIELAMDSLRLSQEEGNLRLLDASNKEQHSIFYSKEDNAQVDRSMNF